MRLTRAIAVALALGLLTLTGCNQSGSVSSQNTGKSPSRMTPPELSTHVSTVGATGAINAVVKPREEISLRLQKVSVVVAKPAMTPAAPLAPTAPIAPFVVEAASEPAKTETWKDYHRTVSRTTPGIRLERVESTPQESKAAAEEDAIKKARMELVKRLERENPPVTLMPTLAKVKTFIPSHRVIIREADPSAREELKTKTGKPDWYVAEVDVELSDDQIRGLRQEERVQTGLIGMLVLAGVGAIGYGTVRLGSAVWQKRVMGVPLATMAILAIAPLLFIILFRIR